jgi:very-short-patch-repair endonuclease
MVDNITKKERMKERDKERTTRLKERGYQIIRFWNNDVLTNLEGVIERIREALR